MPNRKRSRLPKSEMKALNKEAKSKYQTLQYIDSSSPRFIVDLTQAAYYASLQPVCKCKCKCEIFYVTVYESKHKSDLEHQAADPRQRSFHPCPKCGRFFKSASGVSDHLKAPECRPKGSKA